MFGFFNKAVREQAVPQDSRFASSVFPSSASSTPGESRHNATQRELIRVVLRDTLRMNGIPLDWIGCDILPVTMPAASPAYRIELVMHHWHEDLPRYAPLLQAQLLRKLQRFDPTSDHRGHEVCWKFAPDCGCPHARLPTPDHWRAQEGRRAFSLPPTARDQRRGRDDFAPTEPSPLR